MDLALLDYTVFLNPGFRTIVILLYGTSPEDKYQLCLLDMATRIRREFEAFLKPTDAIMEWRQIEAVRKNVFDLVLEMAKTVDLVVVNQQRFALTVSEEPTVAERVILD